MPNLRVAYCESPATDACLNAVRAERIHFAANRMLAAWESSFIDDTSAQVLDISGAVLSALEFLPNASPGNLSVITLIRFAQQSSTNSAPVSREAAMRGRPIIFNAEMVRAILDGRKTQTRRMLYPRQLKMLDAASSIGECYPLGSGQLYANSQSYYREWSPFGAVGDRLWVRETFRVHSRATEVASLP